MFKTPRLILLLLTGLFALGLAACSDDDDPTKPPVGEGDTVAPLVLYLSPSYMDRSVDPMEEIRISFTEPMDPAFVDVTVSSGGALSYMWSDDNRFLRVSHDAAWSAGEKVTATVGTGMKDVEGNPLPQAFSSTFYTVSTELMLLDTMFVGGQDAVLLNGEIVLFFSERMDLTSFVGNVLLEELTPPKAVPGLIYGTWSGDTWTVTFGFDGVPTPNTTYRITVDGSAARTYDGEFLGDDLVITFTTGAAADETGPQILSSVPALGSIAPTSTDKLVVTFSEPIDPQRVEPSDMSGILQMFISREPVWNAAGDEMTVYLQQPLPAGIRLYAVFDDYDFYDWAGNGNVNPDSISFTTQGTADPFPVRDDLKLYHSYSSEDSKADETLRQTMENISGDTFDHVLRSWGDGGFNPVFETIGMSKTASMVRFTSIDVDAGHSACTPPMDFMRLPVVPDVLWDGEATIVDGETNVVLSYGVEIGESFTRKRVYLRGPASDDIRYWLDGCFTLTIDYSMTIEGDMLPVETGQLKYALVPGLGIWGQDFEHYSWDGPTRTDESSGEYNLWGASLDDRYDIDR